MENLSVRLSVYLEPSGSTRISVIKGPTSYIWLEEAGMAEQHGKPTEPRYFRAYVTFRRLRNRWVTNYGDMLAVGTARGPHCRLVDATTTTTN